MLHSDMKSRDFAFFFQKNKFSSILFQKSPQTSFMSSSPPHNNHSNLSMMTMNNTIPHIQEQEPSSSSSSFSFATTTGNNKNFFFKFVPSSSPSNDKQQHQQDPLYLFLLDLSISSSSSSSSDLTIFFSYCISSSKMCDNYNKNIVHRREDKIINTTCDDDDEDENEDEKEIYLEDSMNFFFSNKQELKREFQLELKQYLQYDFVEICNHRQPSTITKPLLFVSPNNKYNSKNNFLEKIVKNVFFCVDQNVISIRSSSLPSLPFHHQKKMNELEQFGENKNEDDKENNKNFKKQEEEQEDSIMEVHQQNNNNNNNNIKNHLLFSSCYFWKLTKLQLFGLEDNNNPLVCVEFSWCRSLDHLNNKNKKNSNNKLTLMKNENSTDIIIENENDKTDDDDDDDDDEHIFTFEKGTKTFVLKKSDFTTSCEEEEEKEFNLMKEPIVKMIAEFFSAMFEKEEHGDEEEHQHHKVIEKQFLVKVEDAVVDLFSTTIESQQQDSTNHRRSRDDG